VFTAALMAEQAHVVKIEEPVLCAFSAAAVALFQLRAIPEGLQQFNLKNTGIAAER